MEYYGTTEPRGEYVLVLEGITASSAGEAFWVDMTPREHVEYYMNMGQDKNSAIKAAAKDRGVHKSEIYKQVL